MIILRVAMGRGFLKGTVKDINTTLAFAKPATLTVGEKSRGGQVTLYEIEAPARSIGTAAATSGTSVNEHVGTVDSAC